MKFSIVLPVWVGVCVADRFHGILRWGLTGFVIGRSGELDLTWLFNTLILAV